MPNPIINRRVLFGSQNEFANPETLAYINATQSERVNFGGAVDSLFTNLKRYGLLNKLKFGLLSPVTLDDTLAVVDIKTASVLTGAAIKGTTDTGFRSQMTTPLPIGIYMKQTGDYVKTGAIPSSIHTLNDTCIAHDVLDNVTGGTQFFYSSFQAGTNSFQGNLRTAGNSAIIDSYSNTANAGRNTLGGGGIVDVSGRWIHNRRSGTDLELYKSGASIGTAANGGGGLPNIEMYLGAQNNAGAPANYANHICPYHLEFSGLTATERNNLDTTTSAYESDLGSLRSLSRNLIWDGNSLSVYDNWGQIRATSYYAYSSGKKLYRTRNFAVAGQTTAAMLADYAAQIAPQFSVSYADNIYVIDEVRNDIYFGATAVAAIATLTSLVTAAKATGFTVVVHNVRLSSYVGNTGRTETQYNLEIDAASTLITANAFGADFIIEPNVRGLTGINNPIWVARSLYSSDANYNTGVAAKIANTDWFVDGTHGTSQYYYEMGYNNATQSLDLIG